MSVVAMNSSPCSRHFHEWRISSHRAQPWRYHTVTGTLFATPGSTARRIQKHMFKYRSFAGPRKPSGRRAKPAGGAAKREPGSARGDQAAKHASRT